MNKKEKRSTEIVIQELMARCVEAMKAGDWDKGLKAAERTLIHEPGHVDALHYTGLCAYNLRNLEKAARYLQLACSRKPNDPVVNIQYALCLREMGRHGIAVMEMDNAERKGVIRGPYDYHKLSSAVQTPLLDVDWLHYDRISRLQRVAALSAQAYCAGEGILANPYFTLPIQRRAADNWRYQTDPRFKEVVALKPNYQYANNDGVIRIGFISASNHVDTNSYLVTAMIEKLRDGEYFKPAVEGQDAERQQVEIYGYDVGSVDRGLDNDLLNHERIVSSYNSYHDLTQLSDQEAADLIHSHGVQVLFVMQSPTRARLGILARKPAPINVNYLLYPGTTGMDFIDYIIADQVVIPEEFMTTYSESVVRMVGCYQPSDPNRPIPQTTYNEDWGFPEGAVVMGCFNQAYKFTPDMFDLWSMLIRETVQKRYLWLLGENEATQKRILEEFQMRGIPKDRIIFSPRVSTQAHMDRLRFCDVILGTFPYDGHTLTNDACWAGTPVVTMIGDTFASRVAASILINLEMQELIAFSDEDYLTRINAVLENKVYRDQLRQRLDEKRDQLADFYDPKVYADRFMEATQLMIKNAYNDDGVCKSNPKVDAQALEDEYMANLQASQAANDAEAAELASKRELEEWDRAPEVGRENPDFDMQGADAVVTSVTRDPETNQIICEVAKAPEDIDEATRAMQIHGDASVQAAGSMEKMSFGEGEDSQELEFLPVVVTPEQAGFDITIQRSAELDKALDYAATHAPVETNLDELATKLGVDVELSDVVPEKMQEGHPENIEHHKVHDAKFTFSESASAPAPEGEQV